MHQIVSILLCFAVFMYLFKILVTIGLVASLVIAAWLTMRLMK